MNLDPNTLDITLLIIFAALVWFGMRTGITGAAIWFAAVWLSITAGAQTVGRIAPHLGLPENLSSAATAIGYVLVSSAVFLIAKTVSLAVKQAIGITPLGWINTIGGIFFGATIGVAAILGIIAVAATVTYVIPDYATGSAATEIALGFAEGYLEGPREWLDTQLTESTIVAIAMNARTLLVPFAPDETGIAIDILNSKISS